MRLFVLLGGLIEKSRSRGTQLRCSGKRVLVVGAGPMGLHAALELRLAGAKVTLLDSRKEFNRVNRLHIWEDYQKLLEDLGAKDLGVKFGTGGYRHVGIADLQFILLKLCLLLGVEVKLGCGFGKKTVRYSRDRSSWVARRPRDGIAAIDAVVFASGKAPAALPVAKRPRAGASAVNQASHGASHTAARFSGSVARREGLVKEGCALGLVFNFKIGNAQQERCWGEFAKAKQFADEGSPLMDAPESENDQDMHASLENCVYYRGPKSHYMIATTSKHSLLKVGVLHYGPAMDGERAVAGCPVDAWQLGRLGPILAARFGMPSLHLLDHKQPCDVFDFSSTERHASSIIFKEGSPTEPLHPLPVCLVGDALMEPFWPTGLGCIRGYMSVLDAVSNLSTWFDTGDQAEVSSRAAKAYHQLKTVNQEGGARHPLKPYKDWGVEPDSRYKLHH